MTSIISPLIFLFTSAWYGPVQVSFDHAHEGNPYDHETADYRVEFVSANGGREERLAYFDDGQWKAWFVAKHPGTYDARLMMDGSPVGGVDAQGLVVPEDKLLESGFVRVRGERFETDEGLPYFPLGHNLGWQDNRILTISDHLGLMSEAGMNWARIWACHWDGKSPFFDTRDDSVAPDGELLPSALKQWDRIVSAADAAGMRFQLVLFHHGLFSSEVNSNWDIHPWNKANGGFLEQPGDFFTDPKAIRWTKNWLRHAVARWGHSPSVMAWELFNEVEWVDPVRKNHDWDAVSTWANSMAGMIRSIDTHQHLIAISSEVEHPALYAKMDFYQPHIYPADVFTSISGTPPVKGKPWFFGEYGGANFVEDREHRVLRDGIWAGILSGHAGAASYWYWERVVMLDLDAEYRIAAKILDISGYPSWKDSKARTVVLKSGIEGTGSFKPGLGWKATRRYAFDLPEGFSAAHQMEVSAYMNSQTGEHAEMTREPLQFSFDAAKEGVIRVRLTGVGANGAEMVLSLDGQEVSRKVFDPQPPSHDPNDWPPPPDPVEVPFAAGPHVFSIASVGADWFRLEGIDFGGLGQGIHAYAVGEDDRLLMRTVVAPEALGSTFDLQVEGIAPGSYEGRVFDLDTGQEQEIRCDFDGGGWAKGLPAGFADSVWMLVRKEN